MRERKKEDAVIPAGVLMIDVKQVAAKCGLGVSTVWKLAKDESSGFPKPAAPGGATPTSRHGWISSRLRLRKPHRLRPVRYDFPKQRTLSHLTGVGKWGN